MTNEYRSGINSPHSVSWQNGIDRSVLEDILWIIMQKQIHIKHYGFILWVPGFVDAPPPV